MVLSPVQSENVLLPTEESEAGRLTPLNPLQPENANLPIAFVEAGRTTEFKPLHR